MDNSRNNRGAANLLASCDLQSRRMPEDGTPLEPPCWVPSAVSNALFEACGRRFWQMVRLVRRHNQSHPERQLYAFQNGSRVAICTAQGFRGFWANWTDVMIERYATWLDAGRRRGKLPSDLARRMPVL